MIKFNDYPKSTDKTLIYIYWPVIFENLAFNYPDIGKLSSLSYAKIYCPSSHDSLDPSVVIAAQRMGSALSDMGLTWGSVDGVRLAVMKKEWLYDKYQKFHDKGDGEWFVTTCLISGMEKDYAIALRTALLRALKLPLNADRPIEEVEKEWKASWNADAVHQEAEAILAGRRPKGVEIRYTWQTDPQWWLPAREDEERRAEAAEKARVEEQQRQQRQKEESDRRAREQQEAEKRRVEEMHRKEKEESDRRAREQQEAAKPKPTDMTPEQKALVDQAREDMADAEKAKSKRQQIALLEDVLENLEKASKLNKKASVVFELLETVEEKLAQLKISPTPSATASSTGSGGKVPVQQPAVAATTSTTLTTFGGKTVTLAEELGRGGYGVVYKGVCAGTIVAVKRFALPILEGPKLLEFMTEATTMMRLESPQLLGCMDLVAAPNNYCLVMQYMDKGSLWDVLRKPALPSPHPLSIDQQFQIAQDMGRGLEALHDSGIIHRDLKSLNVLIDANNRAKVADFGLAKIKTDASSSASQTNMVGTLLWLAPEIVREETGHNRSTDIYSFGLILWEIASRLQPYEGKTSATVFGAKMQNQHERVPEGCPERLAYLMQWCWKAPNERPKAAELVTELDKGSSAAVPLTGGIGLFNAPGNQPKRPAAAPKKGVASPINTGGFF